LTSFVAMVEAQGGDLSADLPVAAHRHVVVAERAGVVEAVDARHVGVAAWHLGAGRARKEDAVSATAGVVCLVRRGDEVEAGQPVFELHTDDPSRLDRAVLELVGAVPIGPEPVEIPPIVIETVSGS
jgi:thymidine phosphorylase